MRPVNKADKLAGESMTAQSIFEVVERYSARLGVRVAPHDLRRTFAKLAHKGHAQYREIARDSRPVRLLTNCPSVLRVS